MTKNKNINHVKRKRNIVASCALSCLFAFFAMTTSAYAANGGNVFRNTEVPAQLHTVYNIVIAIGIAAAAVSLAVCGVCLLAGGEKGMEFCRKWGAKIAMTIAALLIIPNLIMAGYTTFSSVEWKPDEPNKNNPVEATDQSAFDQVIDSAGLGETEVDKTEDAEGGISLGLLPQMIKIGGRLND